LDIEDSLKDSYRIHRDQSKQVVRALYNACPKLEVHVQRHNKSLSGRAVSLLTTTVSLNQDAWLVYKPRGLGFNGDERLIF